MVRLQWGGGPAASLTRQGEVGRGGACSSVQDWSGSGGRPRGLSCGSFQLPGDSTSKARKGKHVRCAEDGAKGVSHVGKRGCGEEVGLPQFFSTPFFLHGGGTLQGAGHSPRGPELGQVGAWPWAPPLLHARPGASSTPDQQLRHRPIDCHGSQSHLDPPRAFPVCRLTGGPGKTRTNRTRVGAGFRRE